MTPTTNKEAIQPQRMMLLAVEDNMGVETHHMLREPSSGLARAAGEGITVRGDFFSEDFRQMEELLTLFPANVINGLAGTFIMTVSPSEPGSFAVRDPAIERRDNEFVWTAEIRSRAPVTRRWSYTRHPQLRHVYLPLFDDPFENLEAEIFHQVPLREGYSPPLAVQSDDWERVEIPLPAALISQSVSIDQCAQLLEQLDNSFNIGEGEFLEWQQDKVTPEAIERIAAELEASGLFDRGQKFNITLDVRGQETTRNKRVRPVARYPITLFDSSGAPIPATLGCSIAA